MRKVAPYILVAFVSVLACLCEATQPTDWSRYECILKRNPFGAKPEAAPLVTTPAIPEVNYFEDLQITALIVGDSGTKVGFVDNRTKEVYLLAQGQAESGIQLVEADFDSESVLLRRNGNEQWISMPASSGITQRKAPPQRNVVLPTVGAQSAPAQPNLSSAEPPTTPTASSQSVQSENPQPTAASHNNQQTRSTPRKSANQSDADSPTAQTSLTSTSGNATDINSGSVYVDNANVQVYASTDYQIAQNEDGSYKVTTPNGNTVDLPALDDDNLYLASESGTECPVIAGNDSMAIGILDDDIFLLIGEDGEESTIVARNNEDETDADEPTPAQTAMNDVVPEDDTGSMVYSSPDSQYMIAFNEETGNYALATPDGIYKFQATDEPRIINLPGGIKLQVIASGEGIDVVQLPGNTLAVIDNTPSDETTEENPDSTTEKPDDLIPLTPEEDTPSTTTGGGSSSEGENSDGGTTGNNGGNDDGGGGNVEPQQPKDEPADDSVEKPEEKPDVEPPDPVNPDTEPEVTPEDPAVDDGCPDGIPPHIWAIMQKADPSMAEERELRRWRYLLPR